jgi:hypothetical protein
VETLLQKSEQKSERDETATAERLVAENWPGKRLIVKRQPTDLWNQVARVLPPKK